MYPVASSRSFLFFFNDTATTEIYTLSLHDALPICSRQTPIWSRFAPATAFRARRTRSEEHTSELQSQSNLVCRVLLEKKRREERQGNALHRAPCAPQYTDAAGWR